MNNIINEFNFENINAANKEGLEIMLVDYPDVLDICQLQKALNIGRSTAYNIVNCGMIRSFRIGKLIRIRKIDVIDFLNNCQYNTVDTAGFAS